MPILIQFFVISICEYFSIYFLLAANVDDADGSFLDFFASFVGNDTKETNSDTGKNNHKLIIASIENQVM